MRLWHYKLIPYLPKDMLVSQWRECIAIKRQWEKGTLKHRLVSYVKNYDKRYLLNYVLLVIQEMNTRDINYQRKYWDEIISFCENEDFIRYDLMYQEHNKKYLRQCYYNLEEKHDRGIITDSEWKLIEYNIKEEL